jgi:hypothetical protein
MYVHVIFTLQDSIKHGVYRNSLARNSMARKDVTVWRPSSRSWRGPKWMSTGSMVEGEVQKFPGLFFLTPPRHLTQHLDHLDRRNGRNIRLLRRYICSIRRIIIPEGYGPPQFATNDFYHWKRYSAWLLRYLYPPRWGSPTFLNGFCHSLIMISCQSDSTEVPAHVIYVSNWRIRLTFFLQRVYSLWKIKFRIRACGLRVKLKVWRCPTILSWSESLWVHIYGSGHKPSARLLAM